MVAKIYFEPQVEPYFHSDSYGYRPSKSAADALAATRKRCWKYNWLLEFDIKGLFDNIDHDLLMKAVCMHTNNPWAILYIQRWLKTPFQMPDGTVQGKDKRNSPRRRCATRRYTLDCGQSALLSIQNVPSLMCISGNGFVQSSDDNEV
jgi:retron-type reverse transcriptase